MLVLARQRDETIVIGDDVEVTVVDIRGDKVRLGINAPRSVSVHRKEIYDHIQRENRQAAAKATPIVTVASQPIEAYVKVYEVDLKDLRMQLHRCVDSNKVEEVDQGMKLFGQLRNILAQAA